jgi:hypothetical protein
MSDRRATLRHVTEVALVVAFLTLSMVAYGAFFVEAGDVMSTSVPAQFSGFYRPGENPWTGPIVAPATPEERLAGQAPARSSLR